MNCKKSPLLVAQQPVVQHGHRAPEHVESFDADLFAMVRPNRADRLTGFGYAGPSG